MKKVLSVLLAVVMLFTMAVPAFAVSTFTDAGIRKNIPIIRISGDGEPLYDKAGNKLLHYKDLLKGTTGDDADKENIYKSIANVLLPFIVEGLVQDKWDNYYKNLQKEISDLMGEVLLDGNGNPKEGTGISQGTKNQVIYDKTHDKKDRNGNYGVYTYYFKYDWRLDPLETADEFNDYIKSVKKVTGAEKVGIMSSCLGCAMAMTYIAKYGTDDICGITMDAPVLNGSEILSETISGKFKIDGDAINRFLVDCDAYGLFSVDEFINATIDLLTKSGAVGAITGTVKQTLYYKLVQGVTSALSLSTFYTWPSYWTSVSAADYNTAKEYVFGPEGSEKRTEYAGLIERLDSYDKLVRQRLPELYNQVINSGVNFGLIAKYGVQMAPAIESCNELGDAIVTVKSASIGATTSSIYNTLSDDYIARRVAEGKGKYISPDKQVDASTCMFPEYTWFVKGTNHSNWTTAENNLLWRVVTAEKQITINDTDSTQFMVYDNDKGVMSPMTELNCNTYYWAADEEYDKPQDHKSWISSFLTSLFRWIKLAFERFFTKADK